MTETRTPAQQSTASHQARERKALYRLQSLDRQRVQDLTRDDIIAGDPLAMVNHRANLAELATIHAEEWQRLNANHAS